jgi:hypothetical protein
VDGSSVRFRGTYYSWVEIAIGCTIVVLVVGVLGAAWYEATFDYTKCDGTDQYRQQHSAAYTTYMKVGEVQMPTFHPAREWTERLYKCPDGDGHGKRFDKWRTENQP